MADHRVNEDGTVSVRRNGVWLPFDEYERIRDNELASARKDVEDLNRRLSELEDEAEPDEDEEAESDDSDLFVWDEYAEYIRKGLPHSPNSGTPTWISTTSTNTNGMTYEMIARQSGKSLNAYLKERKIRGL